MKRIAIFTTFLGIIGALASVVFFRNDQQPVYAGIEPLGENQESGASAYKAWLFEMRKNPATGHLTEADLLEGRRQVMEARARSTQSNARSLGVVWNHLGPTNIGGRTRSIAIDPSNPSRMYGGSVSGGLFVSNDGGVSWEPHPQNPELLSTLISTISIAANGDIYFGTGESYLDFFDGTGSYSHGFTGTGIYKSTDGGAVFSLLAATEPTPGVPGASSSADWGYVNRIACHPTDANIVLAATNRGLRFSTDGGVSWTTAQESGTSLVGSADDVAFASDGRIYAIYVKRFLRSVSTSSPGEFEAPASGLPSPTAVRRAILAIAPSDPSKVFIYASASGTEALLGIYRTSDAGVTWTNIANSTSDLFNPPGGQGNYNLAIVVSPSDPDRVYIGGQLDAWSWKASEGSWDQIAAAFGGELFSKYVHPDHHWFVFHPTDPNILFFGTDGGITRSLNAQNQFPDWKTVNKGYSTFQAHGVAGGLLGEAMGGSQDNGTAYLDYSGNSLGEARQVLGGDGGQAEISKIKPNVQFAWFYDFSANGGALRRSASNGNSYSAMFDANIDNNQNGVADNGADFVEADYLWEDYDRHFTFRDVLVAGGTVEYPAGSGILVELGDAVTFGGETFTLNADNIERARFFCGTNNGLWMTPEVLKNSSEGAPTWFRISGTAAIGNVTSVDATADGNIAYVGTSSGNIWRISNLNNGIYEYIDYDGNPLTDPLWFADSSNIVITNIGTIGGRVTGIDVDDNNNNLVVASRGGYLVPTNVWRTTNGAGASPTWTSISASLPDVPVFDVLIDYYNSSQIFVATEFGVWSYDGTTWDQEISTLGNVPVFEIRQEIVRDPECRVILIGTHGRGFFRSTNLVPTSLGCDFSLGSEGLGVNPITNNLSASVALFPNPAQEVSTVTFQLDKAVTNLQLSVFDLTGKRVMTLVNGQSMPAGSYRETIPTASMANGTYLVVLEGNGGRKSAKLVVMH